MTAPPKLPSMFEQLMSAAYNAVMQPEQPRQWPMNPFPTGVRLGSASDRVLSVSVAAHPRWLEHSELMRLTGSSRGAIAWAVRYLQAHGKLRSIPSGRRETYRKYQAIITGGVGDD